VISVGRLVSFSLVMCSTTRKTSLKHSTFTTTSLLVVSVTHFIPFALFPPVVKIWHTWAHQPHSSSSTRGEQGCKTGRSVVGRTDGRTMELVSVEYEYEYVTRDGRRVSIRPRESYILVCKTTDHWWHVRKDLHSKPFYVPAQYVKECAVSDGGGDGDDPAASIALRLLPPPMELLSDGCGGGGGGGGGGDEALDDAEALAAAASEPNRGHAGGEASPRAYPLEPPISHPPGWSDEEVEEVTATGGEGGGGGGEGGGEGTSSSSCTESHPTLTSEGNSSPESQRLTPDPDNPLAVCPTAAGGLPDDGDVSKLRSDLYEMFPELKSPPPDDLAEDDISTPTPTAAPDSPSVSRRSLDTGDINDTDIDPNSSVRFFNALQTNKLTN